LQPCALTSAYWLRIGYKASSTHRQARISVAAELALVDDVIHVCIAVHYSAMWYGKATGWLAGSGNDSSSRASTQHENQDNSKHQHDQLNVKQNTTVGPLPCYSYLSCPEWQLCSQTVVPLSTTQDAPNTCRTKQHRTCKRNVMPSVGRRAGALPASFTLNSSPRQSTCARTGKHDDHIPRMHCSNTPHSTISRKLLSERADDGMQVAICAHLTITVSLQASHTHQGAGKQAAGPLCRSPTQVRRPTPGSTSQTKSPSVREAQSTTKKCGTARSCIRVVSKMAC
jgi:hypothetical protein